jgi:hypothetical protein
MVSVLPKNFRARQGSRLENITLRGFGGGWDAVDSDLAMEQRFLVKSRNFRRTSSGSQKVRYGSNWFADLTGLISDDILDLRYFSDSVIAVSKDGQIVALDGSGNKVKIWSAAIAAALPGAPTGWHAGLTNIDFVPYKSQLIIHNGVDKPVTVSRALVVTYLQDLASATNVNTPIGKFGCVVSNYHCVAGIPNASTTVFISAVGTAGTFPGDPAPNDSISVDVGAYAPQGAVDIRGIAGFRNNLIVFFQEQAVVIKLGTYNAAGVHVPSFPDAMPNFGALGHRCMITVDNDLLFAGMQGLSSAKRNILSVAGTLESEMLSEKIEIAYRGTIGVLTNAQQLDSCFMVYDKLSHDMLLFTPSGRVFVYSFNVKLRYKAWSEYSGLNINCACSTFLGRVFYASGMRIFQHGNGAYPGENYSADRMNDRDVTWTPTTFFAQGVIARDQFTNQSFVCLSSHTSGTGSFLTDRTTGLGPTRWAQYKGLPIDIELELPWLDSKDPMKVKMLKYIAAATKGKAEFTVQAYVDNLYKDNDGNIIYQPALALSLIANDAPGYGYEAASSPLGTSTASPYGGGRHSNDPRLMAFPVKFKTLKIRIIGMVLESLEFVNLSFLFARGRYKR